MTGVFSDREIKDAIASGQIVIDPFVPANVKGSSVDLRLGMWFFKTESLTNQDCYNPFDPESVKDYFKGPLKAMPNAEWCARHGRSIWRGINPNHPIIVLRPHERILAHTIEFAGIAYRGTTTMQARSTWGRNGIVVCKDAGWGDPGYINRWTMEIQNDNSVSVPLPVGIRVAQMVFYHMDEADQLYTSSKYQAGDDIKTLKTSWTPEMLLPKAYEDVFDWSLEMAEEAE